MKPNFGLFRRQTNPRAVCQLIIPHSHEFDLGHIDPCAQQNLKLRDCVRARCFCLGRLCPSPSKADDPLIWDWCCTDKVYLRTLVVEALLVLYTLVTFNVPLISIDTSHSCRFSFLMTASR